MRTAAASTGAAGPSEGLLAGRSSGWTKRQADDTTSRPGAAAAPRRDHAPGPAPAPAAAHASAVAPAPAAAPFTPVAPWPGPAFRVRVAFRDLPGAGRRVNPMSGTRSQTTCYILLSDGPGGTLHDYTTFIFNIGQLIELGTRTRLNRTA